LSNAALASARPFSSFAFFNLNEKRQRKVWAFDSFEGFPEPTVEDASFRNPKKGEWKVITPADLEDILFRRCGLPAKAKQYLHVTKGYFENTLKVSKVDKISLLHLDVDLYGSYKDCLTRFYHKVMPGGVILFDEYKQKNTQEVFPGAAKAINEFFSDKAEKIEYDAEHDKYIMIKQ
jgi:O-methyltransferase